MYRTVLYILHYVIVYLLMISWRSSRLLPASSARASGSPAPLFASLLRSVRSVEVSGGLCPHCQAHKSKRAGGPAMSDYGVDTRVSVAAGVGIGSN